MAIREFPQSVAMQGKKNRFLEIQNRAKDLAHSYVLEMSGAFLWLRLDNQRKSMLLEVYGIKDKIKLALMYEVVTSAKLSSSSIADSQQPRSPPLSITNRIRSFFRYVFKLNNSLMPIVLSLSLFFTSTVLAGEESVIPIPAQIFPKISSFLLSHLKFSILIWTLILASYLGILFAFSRISNFLERIILKPNWLNEVSN